MRRDVKTLKILLTAAALLAAPGALQAAGMVGEAAADFSLQATDGTTYTLGEYAGRVVMLFLFGYS